MRGKGTAILNLRHQQLQVAHIRFSAFRSARSFVTDGLLCTSLNVRIETRQELDAIRVRQAFVRRLPLPLPHGSVRCQSRSE